MNNRSPISKLVFVAIFSVCLLVGPLLMYSSYGDAYVGMCLPTGVLSPLSAPYSPSLASTMGSSNVHRMLISPYVQSHGIFGWSTAISGNIIAIGAPYENASGIYEAGHVYLFNAKTGALIRTLVSPNAQSEGFFGWSVGLSGKLVIVGAFGETANGYDRAGHAYTFNAFTGSLISTLTSPNAQFQGLFGCPVAISGDIAIVGAPWETADGFGSAGHAYTFNAITGTLLSTLTSPNAQAGGKFGYFVAISGKIGIVGAPWETADGYGSAGNAYTFNVTTGDLISTLSSPNAQSSGEFGWSVAISGNIAVVGAITESASGYSDAGHVYTFNATTGALMSTLTDPEPRIWGEFGWSVAIAGDTVVVGAILYLSGYWYAGHVDTFRVTTGAFVEGFTSPHAQFHGMFGNSVAMSGMTIVIGAPDENASGVAAAGHVYIRSV